MTQKIGPRHKGFYILPNLLTTASLFIGFMGILWAIEGRFHLTAIAILGACVFDGLDGKIARLTNSSSDFGIQFDSLSDLVSFGVCPALTMYLWQLGSFDQAGLAVAFLFMACGALRLARFNLITKSSPKKFFVGLPIPAAACTLAAFILFSSYLPHSFAEVILPKATLMLTFVLGLLMISKVKYASFKEFEMVRLHPFSSIVTAIMIFVLVASEPKFILFLFFITYVFSGLIYTYLYLPLRKPANLREPERRSHNS
ncbi:CDP-diacylglycerol--serine O-phosphatidyltransferase [Desulfonatronovibrio magnus]|uniref:CDP-diacylglycerol--serine O-phosphatidyltransferase n=1 Tax=Desulfonatronovibrio magnus TaxID=698827 RepID=UPI0005EB6E10|nr:CDP-diacylglycerol--serine O-phosphatidyltransferase [Desulfonatronovibrio magnus]